MRENLIIYYKDLKSKTDNLKSLMSKKNYDFVSEKQGENCYEIKFIGERKILDTFKLAKEIRRLNLGVLDGFYRAHLEELTA